MPPLIENPTPVEVRSVIRFFNAKKVAPVEIHKELISVYGPDVMAVQNVRLWCRNFNSGRENVLDEPRRGRPSVVNDKIVECLSQAIESDRRLSFDQMELLVPCVSRSVLHEVVHDRLGYRKVAARWVPKMLTPQHMEARVESSSAILQQHLALGEELEDLIVTGDETWVYHNTPETKLQSSQWVRPGDPRPVKFKQTFSQRKVMATVFWDKDGIILVDFLERGKTIDGERYRETLLNLRKAIKNRRPGKL